MHQHRNTNGQSRGIKREVRPLCRCDEDEVHPILTSPVEVEFVRIGSRLPTVDLGPIIDVVVDKKLASQAERPLDGDMVASFEFSVDPLRPVIGL